MPYIKLKVFIIFILYVNLNGEVYNVFSNYNNIYYSSVNNTQNGFILNNSSMKNNNTSEMSELFEPAFANTVNYNNINYSKDIKYIDGVSGGKAVLLPNGKSFIKIDNKSYFDSRENSINSFNIEFYLNPYQVRMNSKVLSKIAIYNDEDGEKSKYSGIRASIIDGKLVWQFNNLFMYEGKYSNITLSVGETLKPNEWRHHCVSFDSKTGKLVKYIDGLEEEIIYLTSTGDINGSPYAFNINNIIYEPLYLGQGFIGAIDSFSFTPNFKKNFNLYKYLKRGELISEVIDLKDNHIFIDYIDYKANISNGTYMDIYYRISDNYFLPEDDFIEWKFLDAKKIISSGRYIQIKAVLESNSERNISPILNNVEIVYHRGKMPKNPVNLTAIAVNNSVVLKWDGSHENITGYKIYYGTKSGIYNNADNIPIIIGNQNEYVINGLKNGEIYYFAVTAIGGEGGNIESNFSKEVFVRTSY